MEEEPKQRYGRLQWCCLGMLTAFASVLLAIRVVKRAAPAMVPVVGANGTAMLIAAAPVAPTRRRGKRWQYALTMGRMGTSSSFVLRTPRRSIKKQAAKAAMRTVVLIGSHFGAGNDLLKHVFGELVRGTRPSSSSRTARTASHARLAPRTLSPAAAAPHAARSASDHGSRCVASRPGAASTTSSRSRRSRGGTSASCGSSPTPRASCERYATCAPTRSTIGSYTFCGTRCRHAPQTAAIVTSGKMWPPGGMHRLIGRGAVRVRAGVRCPVADDHLVECLSVRRLPRASHGCAACTLQARKARPVRPAPAHHHPRRVRPPLQRLRFYE